MMPVLTIFIGAFAAFLVQPLVGNSLLPVFGGTATVWSVCLAVFQLLLVGGYFYAHATRSVFSFGRGFVRWLHILLLLASASWISYVARNYNGLISFVGTSLPPAAAVAVAVLALVAVPYILLASNSSLVQHLSGGKYRLYAVSNIGSLLGLAAYPILIEPFFPLSTQWNIMMILVVAYAICFAFLFVRSREPAVEKTSVQKVDDSVVASETRDISYWSYFSLSFASCFLLNAVSTYLCTDVTPLPMLWAALLALYLLSYIVAFTDRGASWARWVGPGVVALSVEAIFYMGKGAVGIYAPLLGVGSAMLFFGGWIIHARLYRTRPDASGLTKFYLMISLGGAVGGAVCSFVMPLLVSVVAEYPLAVVFVLCVIALDICEWKVMTPLRQVLYADRNRMIALGALAVVALVGIFQMHRVDGRVLHRYRNFYGTGMVVHAHVPVDGGQSYFANLLYSGGTTHGFQKADGDWKMYAPTCYYAEHAGGLAVSSHPKWKSKKPMRVALCGMGVGTLATYARDGDYYRFFEINPAVADIARDKRYFSYVPNGAGKVDVVVDDARHALTAERDNGDAKYDVIVVDVFTGDAIPPHMITKEAFQIYLDRLEADGILAFHLTNWHINLLPVIKSAVKEFDLDVRTYFCKATQYAYQSLWSFVSRSQLAIDVERILAIPLRLDPLPDRQMMTDDFHSLVPFVTLAGELKLQNLVDCEENFPTNLPAKVRGKMSSNSRLTRNPEK